MATSTTSKKIAARKAQPKQLQRDPNSALPVALLRCGFISSLWYITVNVVVPLSYPGYNSASQVVSELSAIGAPTRPIWVFLCTIYSLLVIAFGLGVRKVASGNRKLQLVDLFQKQPTCNPSSKLPPTKSRNTDERWRKDCLLSLFGGTERNIRYNNNL